MANIKPTNPINIDEQLEKLKHIKFHPNAMVEHSLNLLSDMLDGRVEVIDPSNPVSYVIEIGALNAAFAVQEHMVLVRKAYPELANNFEDLYMHMSDKDYVGRFGSPAFGKVIFSVSLNDFVTKANMNLTTGEKTLIIPRDYNISIEGNNFYLPSPIKIRMTKEGVIDIRFDNDLTDDLFPLGTDYIDFDVVRVNQSETYIRFEVGLPEIKLESKEVMIGKSKLITGRVPFDNQRLFFYAKAYMMDTVNQTWVPMLTTHSEDVWDIKEPTCIVRVHPDTSELEYYIPPVYIRDGRVKNKVKLVIYTTRGAINVSFTDYLVNDFKTKYNKIFPEIEYGPDTTALNIINIQAYIQDRVIGGKDSKTFDELKFDVINNNLRPNLPITRNQIANKLRGSVFELVRNHDVVTSREFLAKTKIPSSFSRYRISRMALDLLEIKTSINELIKDKNSIIPIDDKVIVIPADTVLEIIPGVGGRILTKNEHKLLTEMSGQTLTRTVNAKNYMSTYYHYILDSSNNTTDLRAYDVSHPSIPMVNFRDYNESTLIGVNSRSSNLTKIKEGYRLDVLVDVKVFNQYYGLDNIVPIMVFTNPNGNYFYLEGKLYMSSKQGNIFSFIIETDGYIDSEDRLHVNNLKDANGNILRVHTAIEQDMDIFYCTDNIPVDFAHSQMDDIINRSYLTGKYAVVTQETHRLKFAERMKYLYSRIHTSTGLEVYQYYEQDVYLKYSETIFNNKNEIIHRPGDFVLDEDGKKIVQFKKGDLIIGEDGRPKPIDKEDNALYLNLLLMDYKFTLSNGFLVESYKEDTRTYLRSLILNNMAEYNKELLERTELYLTVPNNNTDVLVHYDGKSGYMSPSQAFRFELVVDRRVYKDSVIRDYINSVVIETLDTYLSGNRILNKTDLLTEIRAKLKGHTYSVSLPRFTELNGDYIELMKDDAEIAIRKKLVITPEGYNIEDDVTIDFILVGRDDVTDLTN